MCQCDVAPTLPIFQQTRQVCPEADDNLTSCDGRRKRPAPSDVQAGCGAVRYAHGLDRSRIVASRAPTSSRSCGNFEAGSASWNGRILPWPGSQTKTCFRSALPSAHPTNRNPCAASSARPPEPSHQLGDRAVTLRSLRSTTTDASLHRLV